MSVAGIGKETADALRSASLDPAQTYRVRDFEITRGGVRFFLTDGYLIFSKPILGTPVAAIFTSQTDGGDGEILLLPPDRDERRALSARAGGANLEEHLVDAAFLFADNTAAELLEQVHSHDSAHADLHAATNLAARYDPVLRRIVPQFEIRLLRDLLRPNRQSPGFFASYLGGKTLSGFNIVFDPHATEEVLVGRPKPNSFDYDIWASFTPRALRGSLPIPDFHAADYRIDSHISRDLHMRVATSLSVEDLRQDVSALDFDLSRGMKLESAEVDGKSADLIETGGAILGDDPGDREFLVVPSEPLRAGAAHTVKILHAGDVITAGPDQVYFVGSRGRWYPHRALEFARFDLRFAYPKGLDLVAPGDRVSDLVEGGERTIETRIETPVPMAGFNLGNYTCETTDRDALTIETCANRLLSSDGAPDITRSIGAKVADVMAFYTSRFGPPPLKRLIVSPIPGKFGQGFGGLIYLSTMAYMSPAGKTFAEMNPESQLFFTELMRAHEAAHQWWGNLVLTSSYHDEWITESLANYSAMLYLRARGENKAVATLLNAYRESLLVSSKGVEVGDVAPVTQVRRIAAEDTVPDAWISIMYGKGTWIMQMLHARMGEERFWRMLAELRRRYERRNLTTEQFLELCASFMPPDVPDAKLRGFFDQWVYGMGMPRLKLAWNVHANGGGVRVAGTLTQSGVPDDFSADFPVYVTCHGKTTLKWVRSSSEPATFTVDVPARPEKVELDPGDRFLKR